MNIFTIIVTYNGMRWYDRCLGSLRNSETPTSVVVIDNASTDGSAEYIKERFPEVHLIESKENLGFAKANNIGMRKALDDGADYVFLLNQDAWVEPNTLTELVKTFVDNDSVGIASPIHLNGAYSGLDQNFASYIIADFVSDSYMQSIKQYYSIPFVNAAAWLVSRECIERVGGFDILVFRHYGEDNNFCQRVLYHKLKIVLNTRCTFCHDREVRLKKNSNSFARQVPYYQQRLEFGNINIDWNAQQEIKKMKRKRLMKCIQCNFRGARDLNAYIDMLVLIDSSRKKNKTIGSHWLD